MSKYQRGKIYKIVSNVTDDVYYGSTTQRTLAKRLADHKAHYNSYKAGNNISCLSSFKLLDTGDYDIVLVEEYPCDTKDQLFKRERYYIENNTCVNKRVPNMTRAEVCRKYNNKNKDRHAQYRKDNAEIIKMKKNMKYNCSCGGRYSNAVKTRHMKTKVHQQYEQHMTQYNEIVSLHQKTQDIMKNSRLKEIPSLL